MFPCRRPYFGTFDAFGAFESPPFPFPFPVVGPVDAFGAFESPPFPVVGPVDALLLLIILLPLVRFTSRTYTK